MTISMKRNKAEWTKTRDAFVAECWPENSTDDDAVFARKQQTKPIIVVAHNDGSYCIVLYGINNVDGSLNVYVPGWNERKDLSKDEYEVVAGSLSNVVWITKTIQAIRKTSHYLREKVDGIGKNRTFRILTNKGPYATRPDAYRELCVFKVQRLTESISMASDEGYEPWNEKIKTSLGKRKPREERKITDPFVSAKRKEEYPASIFTPVPGAEILANLHAYLNVHSATEVDPYPWALLSSD